MRAPVLKDVARLAGVSVQTVSRVVNDNPSVRPETRARVRAAMRALNYQPNLAARTLVTRRSRTLGVITPVSGTLLYAVEDAARRAGYHIGVTGCAGPDDGFVRAALARLRDQAVAGTILIAPVAGVRQALSEPQPVPFVVAGDLRDLPSVAVDNALGARQVTRHLLGLGHRTVHHVSGPAGDPEATERRSGWQQALLRAGRPVPAPLAGDGTARSGYLAGRGLAADRSVTAVFCGTDHLALGVLRALAEAGRHVPGDVSVAGFGDLPESPYLCPPLTTVHQDLDAVGRDAVAALLHRIDTGGDAGIRRHAPRLVVRASTAPPAGVNAEMALSGVARSRRGTVR
ncbi:LacI family DNA-binding transcriptional regulator [Actinoplanes utahensis]|uniref:LacI family DNA-binding transcriptional regulator n=1 Tax=Actinoplanes utahensis TaxID=1869 RepID=UPI0006893CA2|nr:LacI family DNA-binding transcriptional regulator [Actinoplanes utahensis]GIF32678.1 LacI family transcriptional regulator [Actinoplanes utahensis]